MRPKKKIFLIIIVILIGLFFLIVTLENSSLNLSHELYELDFDPGVVSLYRKRLGWNGAQLHGRFRKYHPGSSWVKANEGRYHNGKLDGVWTKWDEDGRILVQRLYDNGKFIEKRTALPWWELPYQRYGIPRRRQEYL